MSDNPYQPPRPDVWPQPAPLLGKAEYWTLFLVLAVCVAIPMRIAVSPPGPPGYNIITGEGALYSRKFSVPEKLVAGAVMGIVPGLVLGGIAAGLVLGLRRAWKLLRGQGSNPSSVGP